MTSPMMPIRNLIQELRANLTWKAFTAATGISAVQVWKMEHLDQSCPPAKVKLLCDLAQKQGRILSQTERLTLLLGGQRVEKLADLPLLLRGRTPLDTWLKQSGSQKSQARILGLDYSTIFHRRSGKFRRFWPARAVEIVRRSSYEIDLFNLC